MRRYITTLLALAGAALWAYTISLGLGVKDQLRSDGLQWMAAFFATPVFVLLTLPAFILSFTRLQKTALTLAVVALALYAAPYMGEVVFRFI